MREFPSKSQSRLYFEKKFYFYTNFFVHTVDRLLFV